MNKNLLFFLLAFGSANAQIFSENFNSGTMPAGWTVENADTSENWQVGMGTGFANFSSGAAFFDDDAAGSSSSNPNALLTSPVINLSAVTAPKLSFKYANRTYFEDSILKVEVFNGTSWVQVFNHEGAAGMFDYSDYPGTLSSFDEATNIDLAPYANANFQLRFVYDDADDWSYGVIVDDVAITADNLATSEVSLADKIKIYPNPVRDNLYIKSDDLKSTSKITVTDMSGKLVKTLVGKSDSYNLSDLPKGTYMILIDEGKDIIRKKIIKQ
jgi:hypothetical protein